MLKKKLLLWLCLPLFFLGSFFVIAKGQKNVWGYHRTLIFQSETIAGLIPKGDRIRPSLLGFDLFTADMYWLKTVQYIGGNAKGEKIALFDFLNLITDLDPRFEEAYHRGMLILPSDGKIEEAEKLLQKGEEKIEAPEKLPYDGGFFYFFYKEDYEKSAEQYQKCVETPGCNALGSQRMLRNLETRRGKYETALQEWLEVFSNPKTISDDVELSKKKIKEALDLFVLNESLKANPVQELTDLIGKKVEISISIDGEDNKLALAQYFLETYGKNSSLLKDFVSAHPLSFVISEETLTTPFPANPYQLSEDKTRVKTKQF